MKVSNYDMQLRKIVSGGHRNIDSYYIILKNQNNPIKYISKAMRLDQDNSDNVSGDVEIKPNQLEIWNYDKMRFVQKFSWDFKVNPIFTCSIYQDNLELTIKRQNSWEAEMKKKEQQIAVEGEKVNQANTNGSQKDYPSKEELPLTSAEPKIDKILKSSFKKSTKKEQKVQIILDNQSQKTIQQFKKSQVKPQANTQISM